MAARRNLKVGVIGCGVIAPSHIQAYRAVPGVEVACLCDIDPQKMRKRAQEFGVESFTENYKDLLSLKELDAVSVCTDHASHARIAADFLDAGKHVICEKSLASSRKNLDLMLEAGERNPDCVFSGVFQHRFDAVYNYLREVVNSGVLGKMLAADLEVWCYRSNEYYNADEWRGTWKKEGGALLINQAIHFIDMISWVTGGVESVSAEYANLSHEGVIECEDTASASVVYKNGALGSITATSGSPLMWEPTLTFTGTEGTLDVRNGALFRLFLKNKRLAASIEKKFASLKEDEMPSTSKTYYGAGHPRQIADFIRSIRTGSPLVVPAISAAHTTDIVLSIYDSCNKGRRIHTLH